MFLRIFPFGYFLHSSNVHDLPLPIISILRSTKAHKILAQSCCGSFPKMKFGKRLQSQLEETIPEWRDKYLSYKQLKKRLKLISGSEEAHGEEEAEGSRDEVQGEAPCVHEEGDEVVKESAKQSFSGSNCTAMPEPISLAAQFKNLTAEELDFIHLLNSELEKFNAFFTEKEEEYVIRLQELKERIERLKDKEGPSAPFLSECDFNEEMIEIRKDFVNFHGEMVLLENYSSLNYTGLVKILKKHDKHTGALLRMPFIQNVLHQPFFTTELLSKLVLECELNLQSLFPPSPPCNVSSTIVPCHIAQTPDSHPEICGAPFFYGDDVDDIYKSTMAALRTMNELRKGSSTYNVFSLPYGQIENASSTPCYMTIPICPKRQVDGAFEVLHLNPF